MCRGYEQPRVPHCLLGFGSARLAQAGVQLSQQGCSKSEIVVTQKCYSQGSLIPCFPLDFFCFLRSKLKCFIKINKTFLENFSVDRHGTLMVDLHFRLSVRGPDVGTWMQKALLTDNSLVASANPGQWHTVEFGGRSKDSEK